LLFRIGFIALMRQGILNFSHIKFYLLTFSCSFYFYQRESSRSVFTNPHWCARSHYEFHLTNANRILKKSKGWSTVTNRCFANKHDNSLNTKKVPACRIKNQDYFTGQSTNMHVCCSINQELDRLLYTTN